MTYLTICLLACLFLRTCNLVEPYADYWLNTQGDTRLRVDLRYWLIQPSARFLMGLLQFGHNVLQWLVSYICTNLAYPICHSVMDTILCTPHPGPPRTLFVRYLYKSLLQ